jgi:CRISPR-associated exonuclease Cas4
VNLMMPYIALFLLLLAVVLFWQSRRYREAAGLPGGRVIYTDTDQWGEVEAPLFDPVAKLTGRPDYLVRQGDTVIPVEVKSGRVPDSPYDSHIFQVAAYCMLVEREYGQRPPYGIIHYDKRTFAIDYTPEMEDALLDLLTEMRRADRRKDVARSHESPPRCRGCGFAYTCEQAL